MLRGLCLGLVVFAALTVTLVTSKVDWRYLKERLVAFNKTYECETGISPDNPKVGQDTCTLYDENFVTLIEHGDILQIKFQSLSGGYQKISNVDDGGRLFTTKYYTGLKAEEILEFRFDFVAPTHCSDEPIHCSKRLLHVANEFTSDHIFITWDGWTDALAGMWQFVADALDDNEGKRTRQAIPNFNGIVNFEVAYDIFASEQVPTIGWSQVNLSEQTSTERILVDGDRLRVWVRATDVMGNTKTDSTFMRIDGSPPTISSENSSDHQLQLNVADGPYSHSSRAMFLAADLHSGVHQIGIKLTVKSPGKDDIVTYQNFTEASRGENNEDPRCIGLDQNGVCLLPTQKVDIDNCWLTVSKEDLVSASGELEITAYNQAMLTATAVFDMGPLTKLQDNGPTKMRIENKSPTGFRLAWDLPETESCYGKADIVIILTFKDSTGEIQIKSFETPSTASFFDFLGLDPEVEYNLGLQIKADGETAQQFGEYLSVVTPKQVNASAGVSAGAVAGMIVGLLLLCALVVLVFFFLTRRGIINVQPQRRMVEIRRAVTKRVRQSRMFAPETQGHLHENKVYAYDNRQNELYLYGGMDFNTSSKGYISRDQITFDVLLKSGHFANIYRARYNGQNVVAKTLKEHFTKDDELLMKAKVNFSSDRVGDHPNVIKFVGAIFCENGTLKDYLEKNKSNMNVEMQENLFRFGLDIAKGMEFLASRGVTHRRLAARNILLNFMNEAKIAGFGPQSADEEDGGDAETGKKERIPIKWVAPECMESTKKANERSDVWSYAVVLWELFSLGETPYTGKSRDLPQRLKKGERLGKPELCDETWYKVMQKCWEFDSKKRPCFAEVREQLEVLFVNSPGDDFYYYKR
ncbi:FER-like protein [Mya arenaria]|uniref:FER-like protein n=1 Tax=Mya arenaria TaxID=6604 RepID=A0ABY7D7L7_MYAAR|nr:FER-like protein [Mya arenaria]